MSAPSLFNFMAELRTNNISRPNQYYVEIFVPGMVVSRGSNQTLEQNKLVSMWCSGASTPQITVSTDDDYIEAGTRRKYAYDQDYQNLVLTFYIDQGYDIKHFFDKWKSMIVQQRRNFKFPDTYTADLLNVYIIDQANKDTYLYSYRRVYPKTIQSVELSYANGVAISTFAVEFVFEEVHFSKRKNGQSVESSYPITNTSATTLTDGIENNELLQQLSDTTIVDYSDAPVDMSGFVDQLDSSFAGRKANGTVFTDNLNGISGVKPFQMSDIFG
jgi:hypothetical protein